MKIKTPRLTITTFSLDMAQAVYENSQDDGPFVYPIITNDGNQNIGYIQLCKVELEEEETWEIGYHIAKNFTGKGPGNYHRREVQIIKEIWKNYN